MPFTLSHPAAVLPLRKLLGGKLVLSALIIGSLAPDFTYFFHLPFIRKDTHSLIALLWFCLPSSIMAYYLFHLLIKAPIYALLPTSFQVRLQPEQVSNHKPINAEVLVSILLGSLTHIIWDSFTHAGSSIVEQFPVFKTLLFEVNGYKVWLYKLLQHGSSVFGFLIILIYIFHWYQTTNATHSINPVSPPLKHKAVIIISLVALPLLISISFKLSLLPETYSLTSFQPFVGDVVKSAFGLFTIDIILYSLLLRCLSK